MFKFKKLERTISPKVKSKDTKGQESNHQKLRIISPGKERYHQRSKMRIPKGQERYLQRSKTKIPNWYIFLKIIVIKIKIQFFFNDYFKKLDKNNIIQRSRKI